MQRIFHGLIVGLLLTFPVAAGTITMQVSCAVQGSNLLVQVENKGDEAARSVSARIAFNGAEIEIPAMDSLPPATPRGVPVGLRLAGLRGTYPAVVTVNFEDLNGYQFSTVSVLQVPVAEARRADILGVLQAKQIRGKTSVPLRIRSEAREPLTVQYRLVLPRELVADVTTGAVTVAAGGQATVAVAVDNFSALPKSEYGLHAVLEYEADGRHFTTVASGSVQVVPPRAGLAWYFWVVAAVVLAAIAVSFIPRGAKRPTGAAQPQARPEPDA